MSAEPKRTGHLKKASCAVVLAGAGCAKRTSRGRELRLREEPRPVQHLGERGLRRAAEPGPVRHGRAVEDAQRAVLAEDEPRVVGPQRHVADDVREALAERRAVHRDEADEPVVAGDVVLRAGERRVGPREPREDCLPRRVQLREGDAAVRIVDDAPRDARLLAHGFRIEPELPAA